jgi:hypothetical protein
MENSSCKKQTVYISPIQIFDGRMSVERNASDLSSTLSIVKLSETRRKGKRENKLIF